MLVHDHGVKGEELFDVVRKVLDIGSVSLCKEGSSKSVCRLYQLSAPTAPSESLMVVTEDSIPLAVENLSNRLVLLAVLGESCAPSALRFSDKVHAHRTMENEDVRLRFALRHPGLRVNPQVIADKAMRSVNGNA